VYADDRWGDSPVHTLATASFLRPDEVHFLDEIGYFLDPFSHIPIKKAHQALCHPVQPSSTAIEGRSPGCLNNWVKANWMQPRQKLPFETFLEDLPDTFQAAIAPKPRSQFLQSHA
jgi:hypothetical protein